MSKPVHKRVWFWLLVIVLVIVIAAAIGAGGSVTRHRVPVSVQTGAVPTESSAVPAPSTSATPDNNPMEDDGWVIQDIRFDNDNPYMTAMSVRLANTAPTDRGGSFVITIFSNGQWVGEARGFADKVASGQTGTVAFFVSPTKVNADPSTFTYDLDSTLN